MKQYTEEELAKILELHGKWWRGEEGGVRADLRNAVLRNAVLSGADLRNAVLRNADLRNAVLSGADLSGAVLSGADLSGADLRNAVLSGAVLSDAVLSHHSIVPEIGPFYVFKKLSNGEIATLYVPRSAKRLGGTTERKCRVSKAKVVSITRDGIEVTKEYVGLSQHDAEFKYVVGSWVKPKIEFSDDITQVCTSGIHCFITKKEAEEY